MRCWLTVMATKKRDAPPFKSDVGCAKCAQNARSRMYVAHI